METCKLVEFATADSGFVLLRPCDIVHVKTGPNATHLHIRLACGDVITVPNTANNLQHVRERQNTPKPK